MKDVKVKGMNAGHRFDRFTNKFKLLLQNKTFNGIDDEFNIPKFDITKNSWTFDFHMKVNDKKVGMIFSNGNDLYIQYYNFYIRVRINFKKLISANKYAYKYLY